MCAPWLPSAELTTQASSLPYRAKPPKLFAVRQGPGPCYCY